MVNLSVFFDILGLEIISLEFRWVQIGVFKKTTY
jgi:hypothetical protein